MCKFILCVISGLGLVTVWRCTWEVNTVQLVEVYRNTCWNVMLTSCQAYLLCLGCILPMLVFCLEKHYLMCTTNFPKHEARFNTEA